MKGIDQLAHKLLDTVNSTQELQLVSATLEEIVGRAAFRDHAHAIVTDQTLNSKQKVTQLLYLIRGLEAPNLYNFFTKELTEDRLWLFAKGKIDYFDSFVQKFQLATEEVGIVYLTTAIPLDNSDLLTLAKDLEKAFGYRVLINHQVDPRILGGAQVRVENLVFDFSLRAKFEQFERQWLSSLNKTSALLGRLEADHE